MPKEVYYIASGSAVTPSHEHQLEGLIAKYAPDIAAHLREARAKIRSIFEHDFELVFDDCNALVFGVTTVINTTVADGVC